MPAIPVVWHPGAYRLPAETDAARRLPYLAGWYHLQEEVSLLPVHLLDPRPGERVLDLCAAPGNKTAQIAVHVGSTGVVVANDLSEQRMNVLRTTRDRLGLLNLVFSAEDARRFQTPERLFDRVLADVPCSCEGTVRKYPHAIRHASLQNSLRLASIQRDILLRAVVCCRPGGRIVYSTCTFAPEENEAVVDAVLRHLGPDQVRLVPAGIPHFRFEIGRAHV